MIEEFFFLTLNIDDNKGWKSCFDGRQQYDDRYFHYIENEQDISVGRDGSCTLDQHSITEHDYFNHEPKQCTEQIGDEELDNNTIKKAGFEKEKDNKVY